jgi:GAF domain-containing protein
VDHRALVRVLSDFAGTLVRDYEVGSVLDEFGLRVSGVLGVLGAGVSLSDEDGALQFVTATGEQVARVEELQIGLREGPCHEAFTQNRQVIVPDLAQEARWPRYRGGALDIGMRSVAGFPMRIDGRLIGALNVYHSAPRDWSDDDVEAAQVLADTASSYVVYARRLTESTVLTDQLRRALDTRIVVEQAKGIIAERHDIDVSAALGKLRGHARNNNAKLHDIAQQVVDGALRL